MMLLKWFLFSALFLASNSEKVIIIGAGAAGMAAAVRLLQNNFTDFLVLEAEDRIGGRIKSVKMGNAYVDLGAEYSHGSSNNIVYDLAKDTLQPASIAESVAYLSDGTMIDQDVTKTIMDFTHHDMVSMKASENKGLTFGEAFLKAYNSTILKNYQNSPEDKTTAEQFLGVCEQEICSYEGCYNWYQPAAASGYLLDDDEEDYSWHGLGFESIFPILENAYLSQEAIEDLHKNKIVFNKMVYFIKITSTSMDNLCDDDTIYNSEFIIITSSIGVIQLNVDNSEPPVPQWKKDSVHQLGISGVVKIMVEFPSHWWDNDEREYFLVWKKEDLNKLDPKFLWIDHMYSLKQAPNNPTVMIIWTVGPMVPHIETLEEDELKEGIMLALNTFFSKKFTVEEPVQIIRSNWTTNPYVRGAYSYDTLESLEHNAREEYGRPLLDMSGSGVPRILIAGEATHPTLHGTVHGAIETGFREADRILPYL